MSYLSATTISGLPTPPAIRELSFEAIFEQMKTEVLERLPHLKEALAHESDELTQLLQAMAYVVLTQRGRENDGAKAVMLPTASGADLDRLGLPFGVTRLLIKPADDSVTPPIAATYEDDQRLRERIHKSIDARSVGGTVGAYIYHAMSASPEVKDVSIDAPRFTRQDQQSSDLTLRCTHDAHLDAPLPGDVAVTVLSAVGNGTADEALLGKVRATLSADTVRPLTDRPRIRSAKIKPYNVKAELSFYEGPDAGVIIERAREAAVQYTRDMHRLGHDVTISGLHHALHQAGVQNVRLMAPTHDLIIAAHEAAYCTKIDLIMGGVDV